MSFWKSICLVAFITFLVYIPSFFNPFIWDDEQFIYKNLYVQNFDIVKIFTQNTIAGAGEQSHYFRPLTTFTFAWDYLWWNTNPFGFHLINTVIHILAGITLTVYLRLIGIKKNIILFTTTVFLLHPVQTEAVTYINSRGDSLYTLFVLASLICTQYYFIGKKMSYSIYDLTIHLSQKTWFAGSIIFFAAAILSKELAIAAFGLHVLTFLIQKNKKYFLRNAIILFTFLLMVLISYGIARITFWHFENGYSVDLESSPYYANILLRFFTTFKIYLLYIGIILFPYPLHMERTTDILTSFINPFFPTTLILLFFIAFFSFIERRLHSTMWIAFGWAWFTGLFIPISGIVPSVGMLYEHWLYLPLVGFSICFGYMIRIIVIHIKIKKIVYYFFLSILVGIFSFFTLYQNYIWADHIRFFSYTLQFNQTARLHNNLAMAYADKGDIDNAIDQYKKAITIGDYYPHTHFNLGNAYATQEKYDLALTEYQRAIDINPYFVQSYISKIKVEIMLDKSSDAVKTSTQLLTLSPENPEYNFIHAYTLHSGKNTNDAEFYFDKAIELATDKNSMKARVAQIKQNPE